MSHSVFRRNVVLLATVPADWTPQRFWSTPDVILSAEVSARNLTIREAIELAKSHNREQMQRVCRRLPVESWAIVSAYIRPYPKSARNQRRPFAGEVTA